MKLTRELIADGRIAFRVFNSYDYDGFAGVTSPIPLIGEGTIDGVDVLIVIDGAYGEIYTSENDYECPTDQVENINLMA